MFVTYPVSTLLMTDAIKIAMNLARASGYKNIRLSKTRQIAYSSWDVTLVVS